MIGLITTLLIGGGVLLAAYRQANRARAERKDRFPPWPTFAYAQALARSRPASPTDALLVDIERPRPPAGALELKEPLRLPELGGILRVWYVQPADAAAPVSTLSDQELNAGYRLMWGLEFFRMGPRTQRGWHDQRYIPAQTLLSDLNAAAFADTLQRAGEAARMALPQGDAWRLIERLRSSSPRVSVVERRGAIAVEVGILSRTGNVFDAYLTPDQSRQVADAVRTLSTRALSLLRSHLTRGPGDIP